MEWEAGLTAQRLLENVLRNNEFSSYSGHYCLMIINGKVVLPDERAQMAVLDGDTVIIAPVVIGG